jgi:hypothetical protein
MSRAMNDAEIRRQMKRREAPKSRVSRPLVVRDRRRFMHARAMHKVYTIQPRDFSRKGSLEYVCVVHLATRISTLQVSDAVRNNCA